MDISRSASFGSLFAATFTVGAGFQLAASVIGMVFAALAPGGFTLNGRPATHTGEAIAAVLVMLLAGMILNTAIAAGGSGVWLLVRKLILKKPSPAEVF